MNKRFNLPYTTQDLFPQTSIPSTSLRFPQGSVTGGSFISTSSSTFTNNTNNDYTGGNVQNLRKMFKRLFKPTTLDFETAMWEIFHLIINPKKMYRSHYYYKPLSNTKSTYSRDDPSFLILLTTFLSISAIAWGMAYSPRIWDIGKLIVYMVMIDFYLSGVVIATISWFVTNKLFNNTYGNIGGVGRYSVNYIEWGFCFDIHCNSFLIIWCVLYVLQFILLPLIRIKKSIFALLLGNSLYFGAIGYYFVITFYGFNSLPFINNSNSSVTKGGALKNPAKLLQMIILAGIIPLLALGWLLSVCFGFNVAYTMVDTYFN